MIINYINGILNSSILFTKPNTYRGASTATSGITQGERARCTGREGEIHQGERRDTPGREGEIHSGSVKNRQSFVPELVSVASFWLQPSLILLPPRQTNHLPAMLATTNFGTGMWQLWCDDFFLNVVISSFSILTVLAKLRSNLIPLANKTCFLGGVAPLTNNSTTLANDFILDECSLKYLLLLVDGGVKETHDSTPGTAITSS